jgi:ketosteroid isomerase-like protein
MKQLLLAGLLFAGSLYVCGQVKPAKPSPAVNAVKTSVEQTLTQMEHDWGSAEIKKDYAAVDKILADDWVGIDYDGKIVAKAQAMADLKSETSTLTSEELGPMTVRVFGNTAVVTGSDTEKSTDRGKDSSGKYVWTDVFVMRNGHWQVVASQSTRAR